MKSHTDRRRLLHAGMAFSVSLVVPPARACEFITSNFKVIHPWSRATREDATSVAVCMTFDNVTQTDRLIGAESMVCTGAEIGGVGAKPFVDFVIPEGQTTVMREAGTYLRLVGLQFELPVGRQYPLTLNFEKVGPIAATLTIDYARFL
ncbi:MAG: copper chaperone PCu(A)C [Burkholderiales bacterium]